MLSFLFKSIKPLVNDQITPIVRGPLFIYTNFVVEGKVTFGRSRQSKGPWLSDKMLFKPNISSCLRLGKCLTSINNIQGLDLYGSCVRFGDIQLDFIFATSEEAFAIATTVVNSANPFTATRSTTRAAARFPIYLDDNCKCVQDEKFVREYKEICEDVNIERGRLPPLSESFELFVESIVLCG